MKKHRSIHVCLDRTVNDKNLIKELMHRLTLYCRDSVHDMELSHNDNEINAELYFDSIIQNPVLEIEPTDKWAYIRSCVKDECLVWVPVDMHAYDYLNMKIKLISTNDYELYLCKPYLSQPCTSAIETRIIDVLKYMSEEYSYTYKEEHIELVKLKLDNWKERRYLDKNYETDYEYKGKGVYLTTFFKEVINLVYDDLKISTNRKGTYANAVYYKFMEMLFLHSLSDTKKTSFRQAKSEANLIC